MKNKNNSENNTNNSLNNNVNSTSNCKVNCNINNIPIVIYANAEEYKYVIIQENKGKSGIYR
jgi:hypothetical protein